ncbi:MAG TPA: hydrogenase 4 subunit B [Rhizomicrobium sp.]|nr:hydrogenase 4 subunit B [Rhizomicrobium sp.]
MSLALALSCIAALFGLSVTAVLVGRRTTRLLYAASFVISAILLVVSAFHLLTESLPALLVLPVGLPWLGAHFRLDAVASFFLVVINLGSAGASFYGIGYGAHEREPFRVLPFYPVFLAGMNLVVLADDAFSFLLSWELMSLASWALVMAHHRSSENRRAGYIYLLMASLGTFALLLAFGLLAGAQGGYAFAAMRASHPTPLLASLALFLVLVGAGSKAGLVPLHVWLPLAHPAAPSHVSALMSGVMTKVAIYAVIRIVFDFLGPPVWWWGIVVLSLGGASALMGVLYALFEIDLKRVLAYSTIENIGFIFVGLGLAIAFRADGFAAASVLALTAALFHVLNHSLLKSVLFFGSGAVLTATGERNMEALGGLIHRMPATALAVLGACAGISALPPFNAFASEWLTFQAILLSPRLPQWGLKLLVPAIGALLALSVALAAACFVRVYGNAFLGRARSAVAASAREVDFFSRLTMLALATLCLLAGIFPGLVMDAIGPAVQSVLSSKMASQASVPWLSIVPIAQSRSSYNGLLVFLFIMLSAGMAVLAIHSLANRKTRRAAIWDCGYPDGSPALQYSAGSFSQPIRRVFGTVLFRAREDITMPLPGDASPAELEVRLTDVIWEVLYEPIAGAVAYAAERLNVLQFLTIRRYLSLVFFALVALLVVLAIWR